MCVSTCIWFNLSVPEAGLRRRHVLLGDDLFLAKFETTAGALHRRQHLRARRRVASADPMRAARAHKNTRRATVASHFRLPLARLWPNFYAITATRRIRRLSTRRIAAEICASPNQSGEARRIEFFFTPRGNWPTNRIFSPTAPQRHRDNCD